MIEKNWLLAKDSRDAKVGEDYSAPCKAAGAEVAAKTPPWACVADDAPVRQHAHPYQDSADWAAAMNEHGARLRQG